MPSRAGPRPYACPAPDLTNPKRHKLELDALKFVLARQPEAGDLIRGGGGIRNLRHGRSGKGKSGGVRVIYYFYDSSAPVFLLDVYAKNEKDDLSDNEWARLADLAKTLADAIKSTRRQR